MDACGQRKRGVARHAETVFLTKGANVWGNKHRIRVVGTGTQSTSYQVAEFTTQHKEVIRRFEVHEERTDQRTAQMNNLLTQFNGAVASLKENNTLIRNVVDNETTLS